MDETDNIVYNNPFLLGGCFLDIHHGMQDNREEFLSFIRMKHFDFIGLGIKKKI